MKHKQFNQQIKTLRSFIGQLRDQTQGVSPEAREQFDQVLEELHDTEVELRIQNKELTRSRRTMMQERQRYRDLFEFAPDGYLVTDVQGVIGEANRAAARLLHLDKNDLIGKPLAGFVAPMDRPRYLRWIKALQAISEVQEQVLHLEPENGCSPGFEAHLRAAAIQDRQGKPLGLRWQVRDVSDLLKTQRSRKGKAAENRRQAALLDAIVEAHPGGIAVLAGPELRFVYTNPAYRYLIPDPNQDPIGCSFDQVWPTRSRYSMRDHFRRVLKTGRPYLVEGIEHFFPDGTRRIFTLQARRIEWDSQPAVFLVLWDLTEQKHAEQALRESEEKFAKTFYSNSAGMVITRIQDGVILDVNECGLVEFGYSREEIIGRSTFGEIQLWKSVDDRARVIHELQEKGSLHGWEINFVRKNGKELTALLSSEMIQLKGQPVIISSMVDITERKQIEVALRESEARLRETADYLSEAERIGHLGAWSRNIDSEETWSSPEVNRIYGLPEGGVPTAMSDAAYLPEYREALSQRFATLSHESGPQEIEVKIARLNDGAIRDIHLIGEFNPQTRQVLGVAQDITERKQTEEALAANQQRLESLLASIQDGFFEVDRDWRFTFINERAADFTRMKPSELLGATIWEKLPFLLGSEHEALFRRVMETRQPESKELQALVLDLWFNLTANPSASGITVYMQDISARKRAELALQESEQKYRAFFENLAEAVVVIEEVRDDHGEFIDFILREINQAALQILGAAPDQVIGKKISDFVIDGQSMAHDYPYYQTVLATGNPVSFETSFGGKIFLVSAVKMAADTVILITLDITERKQAEQALQESEARFRILADSNPLIIWVTKPEGDLLFVNRTYREFFGVTLDQVEQDNWQPLLHPEDAPAYIRAFQVALHEEKPFQAEARVRRADGEWRWIASQAVPRFSTNGDFLGFIGNSLDITERKWYEEELRESEAQERARAAELDTLMNTIPAFVWFSRDRECRQMISNQYGYEFLHMTSGSNVSMTAPPEEFPQHHITARDGVVIPGEELPMQIAARTGQSQLNYEFDVVFDNGVTSHLFGNAAPLLDGEGKISGAVGVFVDVTALKQAEQEAHRLAAENEIKHRLLEQREHERLTIARDLHDGPVQELTGAHYALEGVIYTTEDEALSQALQVIRDTIKREVNELRDYAGELRPPALAKFGLGKAIRSHVEAYQEKHPEIQIHFEELQEGSLPPEEVSLALFRIYQETLINFAKHSRATKAIVRLIATPSQVILEMEDNGIGFSVPKDWLELARQGHLGLVGMRERVEAIGGRMEVDSQPGRGTRIRVLVPIQG